MEWFSLVAVSAAYFAGLGFLLWLPLFAKLRELKLADVGIIFLGGFLLHFVFTLFIAILGSGWTQPYFLIPALLGWLVALFSTRKKFSLKIKRVWFVTIVALGSIYLLKILFDPLWAHDARSIWFFAAKILYFAQGFGGKELWQFPDSYYYHFDYPKLVPVHAAHVAALAGYWNEHLPKLALFWLVLPALCFFSELRGPFVSILFIILAALGITGSQLWTGYMDGYLALYGLIGVLFAMEKDRRSRVISVLAFTAAVSLKQEGLYLFFAFILVWATQEKLKQIVPYIIVLIPVLAWNLLRRRFDYIPWPDFFFGDVVGRVTGRIFSGEIVYPILSSLLWQGQTLIAFIPLGVMLFLSRRYGPKPVRTIFLSLWIGAIYGGILTAIYLFTLFDLNWHLSQSIDRTALPIVLLILLPVALWLREVHPSKSSTEKKP